jgi:hypothetical protein
LVNEAQTAREEVTKVASLILTARRLLAGGRLVNLSAIENRVRLVCDAVAGMPIEEGRCLMDELQNLIDLLGQLDRDLHEQLGELTARWQQPNPGTDERS